jgi:uncharacterized Zn finger protein (UPF0148 family)
VVTMTVYNRECYRCGVPIPWPETGGHMVPVCDPCAEAREARLAARKRRDELRLARVLRNASSDLTAARKRMDSERKST